MKPKSAKERFEMKFVQGSQSECWEWLGAKTEKGYGKLMVDTQTKKFGVAHRLSYSYYVGEIPEGMVVRHRCDNPSCVNPHHLELGTQKDNIQDALKRGRLKHRMAAIGELNGQCRLSDDVIQRMRDMRSSGISINEISESFGVSYSHTAKVCRGAIRTIAPRGQSSFIRNTKSKRIGDARCKVTPEMREQVIAMKAKGMTHREIGEAVGLTGGHVSTVLKKANGGKLQKERVSDEKIERILELRQQGLSQAKIGNAVGVAKATVSNILRKHNLQDS